MSTPAFDLEAAQLDRTTRAAKALQENAFRITAPAPQTWLVQNGDKYPYTVRRAGDQWNCNCPDFQQRGTSLRCKHVEAIRLVLESPDTYPTTEQPKEQNMTDAPENSPERIRWELRQPLDMTRVKRRMAPGSGSVPYLEGFDVIQRANEIFSFGWSFDIVTPPQISRWQRTQTYYSQQHRRKMPVLDDQGNPVTEEVGMAWVTGKITIELDGKAYVHADVGRCAINGDTPEALDMALAGAATDCLKRCFRQLGEQFGNSLYDKEIAQGAGLESGGNNGSNGHNGSNATHPPSAAVPSTHQKTAAAKPVNAAQVVFSLKPKTRPELTGKTLGELQKLAPDILSWLANDYAPTPETQAMKDAARALVQSTAKEAKLLSELGFAS